MLEISELRDQLLIAAKNNDVNAIRRLAKAAQQVDFAEVLEELDDKLVLRVFRMLDRENAGDIFSYLTPDVQEFLIGSFSTLETKGIVDDLYSDDLVDVIDEMPAKIVTKILRSTSAERRAEINNILKYDEKSAGGMMSVNFVEIKDTDTVAKAIKTIREIHKDFETMDVLFVMDQYGYLKGTFEIKDLIFNDPKTKIQDIMDSRILFVESDTDQEEVIAIFKRYDVNSLPVVDKEKKVIGIITVDDAIDIIDEEATEDISKLAGVNTLDDHYFNVNVWKMFSVRILWLVAMLIIGSVAQILMIVFFNKYGVNINNLGDKAFAAMVLLAPMAILLAGVVGVSASQSSTLMVRMLSLQEVKKKEIGKIVLKEFITSLLMAAVLIGFNVLRLVIIYVVEFKDLNHPDVWKAIGVSSITLLIGVVVGNLLGILLPLLVRMIKVDPAVASFPLVTTLLDIIVVCIFFGVGLAFF